MPPWNPLTAALLEVKMPPALSTPQAAASVEVKKVEVICALFFMRLLLW